jgi:hypothetical protein
MSQVIISRLLNEHEFRNQYNLILEMLASAYPNDLALFFGFAWGDAFNNLQASPENIRSLSALVQEAEGLSAGKIGADNLHISWDNGKTEIIFCHESDIHLLYNAETEIIRAIFDNWNSQQLIRYKGTKNE